MRVPHGRHQTTPLNGSNCNDDTQYRGERPMMLRLILVGLVAGLGLSLPSRRDFDTMTRCANTASNSIALRNGTRPICADQAAMLTSLNRPSPCFPSRSAPHLPLQPPSFRAASCSSPDLGRGVWASVLNDSMTTIRSGHPREHHPRARDQQVESHGPLVALESAKSSMIDIPFNPCPPR